jgi:hypothetical protein
MNSQRFGMQALAVSGLVLIVGAGCHESSSEGAQPAASADPSASAAAAAASASAAEPTAANAPDEAADDYDDTDPSALTDFHQTLDPAGKWVDDAKVGTIWVPAPAVVGANFVPYQTGGHWVYGDDYVWVSDYDWGWAPFHYGRWSFIEGTGWGWIPGRVYAPAWVSWRVGAPGFGFVGWAPLAPTWGWRAGVAVNFGFQVAPRWSYCATGDVFSRSIGTRVVTGPRATQAENGTKPWGDEGGGSESKSGSGSGSSKHGSHSSGPPPSKLGLNPDQVPHIPPGDPGLQHAQAFSKPSTATSQGAHAPTKTTTPNLKENPAALPSKNAKSSDTPPTNTKPPSNLHAPVPADPKEPSKDSTHGSKPSSGGKKEK